MEGVEAAAEASSRVVFIFDMSDETGVVRVVVCYIVRGVRYANREVRGCKECRPVVRVKVTAASACHSLTK